ncbi:DEAD/DEAH box helicase [Paracoccus sp. p4-l81]|uniref:DEAD/DEAH box helicase n=1 Tax=Paracoccus sp. p4-l81 TaxID=3342806 RepID=UPI0035B89294
MTPRGRPPILFPLFAGVETVSGIGDKLARALEGLRITRLRDALFALPNTVIDRRPVASVRDVVPPGIVTVTVTVLRHHLATRRGGPTRVVVRDAACDFTLIFFHARGDFLARQLPVGARRVISGKVELFDGMAQIVHPDQILTEDEAADQPRYQPVYPLVAGVTQKSVTRVVRAALDRAPDLPDWIDPELKCREGWPDWRAALIAAHAPQGLADVAAHAPARARLAYDELFAHQLTLALARRDKRRGKGRVTQGTGATRDKILAALPFSPTGAQIRAVGQIAADMAAPGRMNRLLQGDVGSGKTLVALLAAAIAAEAGGQAVLMAPTEILARQHLQSLAPLAHAAGLRIALLTGRDKGADRAARLADLAQGRIDLLIGTHAVFQPGVEFADLRLAIIDEQHRFGVAQRMELGAKGQAPDVLVMTATPIPRSLSLAQYGDMDISLLDEKPPGRSPVTTALIAMDRLEEVVQHLAQAIAQGRQAYWVCPLVEDSELTDLTAAETRFQMLRARLEALGLGVGQAAPAAGGGISRQSRGDRPPASIGPHSRSAPAPRAQSARSDALLHGPVAPPSADQRPGEAVGLPPGTRAGSGGAAAHDRAGAVHQPSPSQADDRPSAAASPRSPVAARHAQPGTSIPPGRPSPADLLSPSGETAPPTQPGRGSIPGAADAPLAGSASVLSDDTPDAAAKQPGAPRAPDDATRREGGSPPVMASGSDDVASAVGVPSPSDAAAPVTETGWPADEPCDGGACSPDDHAAADARTSFDGGRPATDGGHPDATWPAPAPLRFEDARFATKGPFTEGPSDQPEAIQPTRSPFSDHARLPRDDRSDAAGSQHAPSLSEGVPPSDLERSDHAGRRDDAGARPHAHSLTDGALPSDLDPTYPAGRSDEAASQPDAPSLTDVPLLPAASYPAGRRHEAGSQPDAPPPAAAPWPADAPAPTYAAQVEAEGQRRAAPWAAGSAFPPDGVGLASDEAPQEAPSQPDAPSLTDVPLPSAASYPAGRRDEAGSQPDAPPPADAHGPSAAPRQAVQPATADVARSAAESLLAHVPTSVSGSPAANADKPSPGASSVVDVGKPITDGSTQLLSDPAPDDAGLVALVHGQMPPEQKDAAMAAFADGRSRVLVATTVIEVGVNVPNASIMVIERAESFGLAQLHQLRGRVGRGAARSTCLMLFQPPLSETASRRLSILRDTEDGFRIAEEDLALRGAGDLIGTAQAGLPRFQIADLERQAGLMAVAQSDARKLLADDPGLVTDRGQAARVLLWLMEQDRAIRLLSIG